MNAAWTNRTPRERGLILLAAMLVSVALAWQVVLNPLLRLRSETMNSHMRASQTLVLLSQIERREVQAIPEAGAQRLPLLAADDIEREVVRLAALQGLELKTAGTENYTTGVSLTNTDPGLIFGWLSDVEMHTGVTILRAEITRIDTGLVDATFEFSRPEAP